MWLYIVAVVLLVAGLVGGVLTGGIFTIMVLPLGAIVLIAAIAAGFWGRSEHAAAGGNSTSELEPRPLPHSNRPQPGTAGTTRPEELVDARREAQ